LAAAKAAKDEEERAATAAKVAATAKAEAEEKEAKEAAAAKAAEEHQAIKTAARASVYGQGPTCYLVSVGICFIKPSEDPASTKILKAKRPVGSKIYTTGVTWKGAQGGLWAEVDVARSPGDMGWMLVSGPGFGLKGPALIDPAVADRAWTTIQIKYHPKDPPFFTCFMPKNAKIGDLIDILCSRTGLNHTETILTKGLPAQNPNGQGLLPVDYTDPKDVLFREQTVQEANIRDCLQLVYTGHFDEDYTGLN